MRALRLTHEKSYGEWDLRIGPFLFIYDTDWHRFSLTIINPDSTAAAVPRRAEMESAPFEAAQEKRQEKEEK